MQKQILNIYKKALEAKRMELIHEAGDRDAIYIQKAADEVDELQLAMDREVAIRNLDREAILLRDVRAALARTEDGGFGTCLLCEEEIHEKRLTAVPWAAHCLACQELLDQHQTARRSNEQMQFS